MLPYMRPIYPAARIGSPAVTVLCHPGDNLMFHAAIEVCKPGDVLVVATHSDSTDGFFGELLATSCQAHGIKGLVIHAGVRDVADLTAMQFPAFSRAISAQGTVKETAGYVNIDIVCAGALVHPGDVIVGDVDGIVVVPRQQAAEVVRPVRSAPCQGSEKPRALAGRGIGSGHVRASREAQEFGRGVGVVALGFEPVWYSFIPSIALAFRRASS